MVSIRGHTDIIGFGESDLDSEITIIYLDDSEIGASIEIAIKSDKGNLQSEFEILKNESNRDLTSELAIFPSINMRGYIDIIGSLESDLDSEVTISRNEESDLTSTIDIAEKIDADQIDAEITVLREDYNDLTSTIDIAEKIDADQIDAEITVLREDYNDLNSDMAIIENEKHDDLDSSMSILGQNDSELQSEITVARLAAMRGYIDILGSDEDDLDSEMHVGQWGDSDLESSLTIADKDRDEELDSEITVVRNGESELDSEIFISPNTTLRGYVDIIEPPEITKKIYPIKDSAVRESFPIVNYGKTTQMMAGLEGNKKKMISYLGFELEMPEDIEELLSAKIVLHKEYITEKPFFMGLYETSDEWLEDYITWNYRPTEQEYLTQFSVPTEVGRVDVDITDYVLDWGNNPDSRSFTLHPRNFNFSELTAFSTKEGANAPYIELIYYEIPKSLNFTHLDAEMLVVKRDRRELSSELEVVTEFTDSDLPTTIELESKDDSSQIDSEISVGNRLEDDLELSIELEKKEKDSQIETEVIVPYTSSIDSNIEIERKAKEEDIDSELTIRAYGSDELSLELEIKEKQVSDNLDTEITVKSSDSNDLDSDLQIVEKIDEDTIDIDLTVRAPEREDLDTYIEIENKPMKQDGLDIELEVRVPKDEDLETNIEIENKPVDEQLDSEVVVSQQVVKDLESELTITEKDVNKDLELSIIPRAKDEIDLGSEIEVPKVDAEANLDSTIIIPFAEDLESSIEIKQNQVNQYLEIEIELEKKEIESQIDTEMVVRAFNASEIESSIIVDRSFEIEVEMEVRSSGGDYAFII